MISPQTEKKSKFRFFIQKMKGQSLFVGLVGLAALAALASMYPSSSSSQTELMYGRGNNWGGFLDTDGEGYPRARPANSLTKSDLALLKVAHDEELSENKESATSKKHDMAALQSRDKRLAKAKREQQEMHKQQLAAVPAPLVKASHHKANHLSLKDQSLLKIAEREQTKENKDALKAKKVDEAAEKVRAQQQKAKLAAKKVSHAKHAQHATAMAAHKAPTAKHNWGGFLPVHKAKAGLDARAMRLLKSATADQEHDMKAGKAARARDQQAFNKLNGGNIDTGKVHDEAAKEFARIERRADIGLNRATAIDNSQEMHAWGHTRG